MSYDGPIVDCDVHHHWRDPEDVIAYLPREWREHARGGVVRLAPPSMHYPFPFATNKRLDSFGEDGAPPGSDYRLLREQLLDRVNIVEAILTFDVGEEASQANPYFAQALCRAANDWSIDHWLSGLDDRLRGALLVSCQLPEEAAAEIRRIGHHPALSVVLVPDGGLGQPLGHPIYHPVYAAAAEYGLPIAIHFGAALWGGLAHMSAAGLPLNRVEYYSLLNQAGMHHLSSFITHGVFDRFPTLRLIMLETGFTWVPSLFWRLDGAYDALRREGAPLRRLPSEYLTDHVRVSTQPFEPGPRPNQLAELLLALPAMEHVLCFSSDYPHWDTDEVDYLARQLPAGWLPAVFHDNARSLLRDRAAA
jgi:uncharacterized protein